jgi:ferredoxin
MVSVNKQTCIGCGNCKATCPDVFDLKDGKAFVKSGQSSSKAPCVKEAIEGCPTNSIKA